jgi:hypothetical protein
MCQTKPSNSTSHPKVSKVRSLCRLSVQKSGPSGYLAVCTSVGTNFRTVRILLGRIYIRRYMYPDRPDRPDTAWPNIHTSIHVSGPTGYCMAVHTYVCTRIRTVRMLLGRIYICQYKYPDDKNLDQPPTVLLDFHGPLLLGCMYICWYKNLDRPDTAWPDILLSVHISGLSGCCWAAYTSVGTSIRNRLDTGLNSCTSTIYDA